MQRLELIGWSEFGEIGMDTILIIIFAYQELDPDFFSAEPDPWKKMSDPHLCFFRPKNVDPNSRKCKVRIQLDLDPRH